MPVSYKFIGNIISDSIETNSVTTNNITLNNISTNDIVANTITANNSLTANSASITNNLTANNLIAANKVTSSSGNLILSSNTNVITLDTGNTLSSSVGTIEATSLRNKPLAVTAPVSGDILKWSGTNWAPIPGSLGNNITVGTSGADYTNLTTAIVAASALSPSSTNPVHIKIYPGIYVHSGTIIVPSYVTISGVSEESVIIKQNNTTVNVIELRSFSRIDRIQIRDATGAIALLVPSGEVMTEIGHCIFRNNQTCININAGGICICHLTTFEVMTAETIGTCVNVSGKFLGSNFIISNNGLGTINRGFIINTLENIELSNINIDGCVINGIEFVNPSGNTAMNAIGIKNCNTGFLVSAGKVSVSSALFSSNTTDFNVASGALFRYHGISFDITKTIIAGTVYGAGISDQTGETIIRELGQVNVGDFDRPGLLGVGGGSAYVRTMEVLSNSNGEIGTWINNTTVAKDQSHTLQFNGFQGTGVENSMYIGSGAIFYGFIMTTNTALVGGSIVFEYWNGASWTSFNIFVSKSTQPYTDYIDDAFTRLGEENIRIDSAIRSNWQQKILNGSTKYWIRARITSIITTIPVFCCIKIRPSAIVINTDGLTEYFGLSQPKSSLISHKELLYEIVGEGSVGTNVNITPTLRLIGTNNRFSAGGVRSLGGIVQMQIGMNTAEKLEINILWFKEGTGTASNTPAIRFQLEYLPCKEGTLLDGNRSSTTLQTDINSVPTQFALQLTIFTIPINKISSNEFLAFRIIRRADQDFLSGTGAIGAIVIVNVIINGMKWR